MTVKEWFVGIMIVVIVLSVWILVVGNIVLFLIRFAAECFANAGRC